MKKWGRISGVLLGLFLISLIFPAVPVQAQEDGSLNLTTSPLPISLATDPGSRVSTELRIKNSGSRTEHLQVGLLKFGANDNTGQPRLADREPGDEYFDWVSFSEEQFYAEPNVWRTINMNIDVPESGGLGYYYAVTFTRVQDSNSGEGADVHGGTAVLVLLDVKVPYAQKKLEALEFKASHSVYEFLPAEFSVSLRNSGNIHLVPGGNIFITKGDKEVAVLTLNEGRGNVLPDSTRTFAAIWSDGFPRYEDIEENGEMLKNEDGTPKRSLKWNLGEIGKLRFGKYKATLVAVYDDGQNDVPVEAVLTFWVIPWRIIFFGILIVCLLLAGPFLIVRRAVQAGKKRVKSKKAESDAP